MYESKAYDIFSVYFGYDTKAILLFFFLNFMFAIIHKYDFKLFVIFGVKNLYCW